MSDSKVAGVAAILFALLFLAAMVAPGETPSGDDSDADFVKYYQDSGNQNAMLASVYFMTVASLALVVLATLGFRSGSTLASIARASAYLAATAFALGAVAIATVGVETLINDTPVDPGVARFLPSIGYGTILIVGGLSASAAIAAISGDWKRTGAMPSWLCWLGFVCAVVLLAGVMFLPMIALVVWALVAGVTLLTKSSAAAPLSPARPA